MLAEAAGIRLVDHHTLCLEQIERTRLDFRHVLALLDRGAFRVPITISRTSRGRTFHFSRFALSVKPDHQWFVMLRYFCTS